MFKVKWRCKLFPQYRVKWYVSLKIVLQIIFVNFLAMLIFFQRFKVFKTTVPIFCRHMLFGKGTLYKHTAPSGPGPPHCRGFTITHTHTHTPHSVGLLWTSDQPIAETSASIHNTQTRQASMPPGGIRTRNPSKWAVADPRLRPRCHWERHWC